MVTRGYIEPSRLIKRPLRQFADLANYDREEVASLAMEPELFPDEVNKKFQQDCEEWGYYYDVIGASLGNRKLPVYQLSGNWEKYAQFFKGLPLLISPRPEHFVHMMYHTKYVICCECLPQNEYQCIDLPVWIFDGPPSPFCSVNSPSPENTVNLFLTIMSFKETYWKKVKVW